MLVNMLRTTTTLLCLVLLTSPARAADPPAPAIPADVLDQVYHRELGPLYTPQTAPKLPLAHQLLEQYFAQPASQRKPTVMALEQAGLDPAILGRLARIRLHWPLLESGVYYVNERVGPHPVQYFFGIPKTYDRSRAFPLVIKLPSANAFTNDPKPTGDEVARIYDAWIKEELEKHPDAIVMMPLLNLTELWGPSYAGMNSVFQPLLHITGRVNVDPARVYLLGQGMSAHATWNHSVHYPTYYAAIAPMAGGTAGAWQKLRLANLRNILTVVWHDADDQVVKVALSRQAVGILRRFQYDVEFEETKNVGHAPTDEIAERVYKRMRGRTRELYPKEVVHVSNRPDSVFNRNDWLQVYQMLNPGPDQRMRLQYGTGLITLSQNSYTIAAAIKVPNRIEITSQNVASFRIYLNDQMVDLSKPIVVSVNRRVRFEGAVKQSIDEMLKDQVFLGRGWRYYTAFLDIDLTAAPPMTRPAATQATQPTTRKGRIEIIR